MAQQVKAPDYDPLQAQDDELEPPELTSDTPPNAADRRNVRRDEKRDKDRRARLEHAMRQLLVIEEGRELLTWLIVEKCGLLRPIAMYGKDDETLQFFAGAQAVGQEVMNLAIKANQPNFIIALTEHLTKESINA